MLLSIIFQILIHFLYDFESEIGGTNKTVRCCEPWVAVRLPPKLEDSPPLLSYTHPTLPDSPSLPPPQASIFQVDPKTPTLHPLLPLRSRSNAPIV